MPRQVKPATENGERKIKKSSSRTDSVTETKRSSSKSNLVRRDSLKSVKSSSSQAEIRRTTSSKSIPPPRGASEAPPQRRDSVTSEGTGFLAKVTCWQNRVDPELDANINKKRKQRPVSIAGDAESLALKSGGVKRTPSMGSLAIPENVRPAPPSCTLVHCQTYGVTPCKHGVTLYMYGEPLYIHGVTHTIISGVSSGATWGGVNYGVTLAFPTPPDERLTLAPEHTEPESSDPLLVLSSVKSQFSIQSVLFWSFGCFHSVSIDQSFLHLPGWGSFPVPRGPIRRAGDLVGREDPLV